jgi:xylan 1,4-beta-xylosidase
LLTRKKDGSLVVAVWNYAPPEKEGAAKTVTLKFKGASPSQATISVVDPQHGDVQSAYESMGSPQYPMAVQQHDLRKAAELAAPEARQLSNGELTLTLPSYALAVVTVK